jgi:vacuolar iron transporter family protein
LDEIPEIELGRLAEIYEKRGLTKETALLVATELTKVDALGAHVRDELGINEVSKAKPIQAALASGSAFLAGGVMPLLVTLFFPVKNMELFLYGTSILFLALLGGVAARTGGSKILKAVLRVTFWGTIAMGLTAVVGYFFGAIV